MERQDLHSLAKSKLYILKFLQVYGKSIPIRDLLAFILEKDKINYFFFMQYLQELEATGLIQKNQETVGINPQGKEALALFEDQLSQAELEEIVDYLKSYPGKDSQLVLKESGDFYQLGYKTGSELQAELRIRKNLLTKDELDLIEERGSQIWKDFVSFLRKT